MLARTIQFCDPTYRNLYARSGTFCVPKINCRPDGTGIFTDESWNCVRCMAEPRAYMPWVPGDVFYLQSNFSDFHHEDPENITDGFSPDGLNLSNYSFKAELCYPGGTEEILANFAVEYMTAWNGTNNYQIVAVDTGLALFNSLDCWELKISVLDDSGNIIDFMSTQTFKKAICPEDTVLIKSSYSTFDCLDNYYGEPVTYADDLIIYDNTLRFWGLVANIGISSNASFDFTSGAGSQSSILYRFNTTEWYPPYQRKLLKVLLDSFNFTIDNKNYRRPAYNLEGGFFKIPLEEICNTSAIC